MLTYIALGSNMGCPNANLNLAIEKMTGLFQGDIRVSSFWHSAPQNMAGDAEDFLNAVIAGETLLSPRQLLIALQNIENKMGRSKLSCNAGVPISERYELPREYESRLIDLDIIYFENHVIAEPDLEIPHPRAFERLFVLLPLQELCSELYVAGTKYVIATLISACVCTDIPKRQL